MILKTANRKKAFIKIGMLGPSGSGKSFSSIQLAKGLVGDFSKVGIIDAENGSADLYDNLGPYKTLTLSPPFSPERYIEAIDVCINAGIECIIIDTSSREWEFLLDYHASLPGSSFNSWSKVGFRHDAFVNKMLQANAHIICTIRSKTEYILSEKNGRTVPEKVGMKGVQRENLEFEFSLVFELDMHHRANISKDRSGIFVGRPEFVITEQTGVEILQWCNAGSIIPQEPETTIDDVLQAIAECVTNSELLVLFNKYPHLQQSLSPEFTKRRREIALLHTPNNQTANQNGIHTS